MSAIKTVLKFAFNTIIFLGVVAFYGFAYLTSEPSLPKHEVKVTYQEGKKVTEDVHRLDNGATLVSITTE